MSSLWRMVLGSTSEASRKNCRLALTGNIRMFGLLVTTVALVTFRQTTGGERFDADWTTIGAALDVHASNTLVPAVLMLSRNVGDFVTDAEMETGAESAVAPVLSVASAVNTQGPETGLR